MNHSILLLLGLALSFGCAKKAEEVSPAPTEVASASPPATLTTTVAAAAPEPQVDLETLSVEEDFEEEAEKDLNAKNLVAKLDEIEKEMGSQ